MKYLQHDIIPIQILVILVRFESFFDEQSEWNSATCGATLYTELTLMNGYMACCLATIRQTEIVVRQQEKIKPAPSAGRSPAFTLCLPLFRKRFPFPCRSSATRFGTCVRIWHAPNRSAPSSGCSSFR